MPEGVEVRDRTIGDEEALALFRGAALLVLPYRDATQSALIAAAARLGVPSLVTRDGRAAGIRGRGGDGLGGGARRCRGAGHGAAGGAERSRAAFKRRQRRKIMVRCVPQGRAPHFGAIIRSHNVLNEERPN